MKKSTNIALELHSEKVRNLLEEAPPSFVRWGTAIIVAVFFALFIVVCFVPYPYSKGETILQHILTSLN